MVQSDANSPAFRLTLLSLVVVGFIVALLSRLWSLQVLAGERYAQLAERNRVRFVVSDAPRGRILDRNGEEIVKNRPALTVSAYPNRLLDDAGQPKDAEASAVMDRLAVLLQMPREKIIEKLTSRKYSPFRSVPLREDVPPEVIFTIEERKELYPGVEAETLPVRSYPQQTLAAQLLGYIGEISEEELAAKKDYRPGELVGQSGLERTYESQLRGQAGLRKLEVSARGVILDVLGERAPVPGNDLRTTLDLKLQRAVEDVLKSGIEESRRGTRDDGRPIPSVAGSAVVLDAKTGEVLAMTSWPTYDPKVFVGGIREEDWAALNDPKNEYPLLNRAIQSAYPPGSTFKPVSGAAAMAAGLVAPDGLVPCPPTWQLGPQVFHNWNTVDEGSLNLPQALMRSCDTYFYELAWQQWLREYHQEQANQPVDETVQRIAQEFGLGQRLGIDVPGEETGSIPGRSWKRDTWLALRPEYCRDAQSAPPGSYEKRLFEELCEDGGTWRGGDAVNMAIGQGDVAVTPLQLAVAYATIANGGTLWQPHVGREVVAPDGHVIQRIEPKALHHLSLPPEQLGALQEGARLVIMDPMGTGNFAFAGFPLDRFPMAGKTGTAEFGDRVPYAWFVGYGPTPDPKYVVAVSVEQGSHGSETAAPIARRIFEAAFGLPVSPFRAGVAVD